MQPRSLLIGPGGAKGFIFIGALSKLEQFNLISDIEIFAGVSAGAIIATLCNVGLNSYEIFDIALTIDLFQDITRDVSMTRIMQSYGLLSHDTLREKLNNAIRSKLGYIPTFRQLHHETKKTLYIGVTSIKCGECDKTSNINNKTSDINNKTNDNFEFFSYRTTPDLSIIDAVIMSSSIPLAFECISYKNTLYIDGGLSNPYPIDILYKLEPYDTIGICLNESLDLSDSYNILSFLQIIITIPLRKLRLEHIEAVRKYNVINLELQSTENVILGFDFALKNKYAMVISGYMQTDKLLSEIME